MGRKMWYIALRQLHIEQPYFYVAAQRTAKKEKTMKKRTLALFLTLALVGSVLSGCGDGSGNQDVEGNHGYEERKAANEIVVGIAQDLEDSLDPHISASAGSREVLFNIYEGLVKPNSDGELICAVAQDYQISPDGRTYTFQLRPGVRFHNGQEVTAADVVYSIERCADASGGAPLVAAFSVIQEVKAVDESTVTITIAQPDLDFISYLTTAIVPEGYDQLATAPMGTGPFRYVSRSPQENIIIEKFDDYWGEGAKLDKVTYKIYEDSNALLMALKGGSIDLCAHLTDAQASQLDDQQFQILEGTMNLVQAVYLNNKAEPFDDMAVRQALCYAIDRQAIMDFVAGGRGTPVGSSMYPAFTKYFMPELADYYTYDPAKAKELLAEAGYPNGFDMTIMVASNNKPHVDTAEVVAQQLRAVGVNVTIQQVEWQTWYDEAYKGRNYQATIIGVDASNLTARAMLERFVSTDSSNFINYNNPEYDQLFQQAITTTDPEEQTALYKQMQTLLTETAANLYIQDLCDLVAMRQGLTGLVFYPTFVLDLSTIGWTA